MLQLQLSRQGNAMSYDLYVFHSNEPQTDESVAALCDAFSGLEDTPGSELATFLEDFGARAREISDVPSGEPWRGEIDTSQAGARIGIPMATPHEVAELVVTLAEKHELFAFDPQTGAVLTGPKDRYHDNTPDHAPGVGTVILVLGLPLILLALVGYWLFF